MGNCFKPNQSYQKPVEEQDKESSKSENSSQPQLEIQTTKDLSIMMQKSLILKKEWFINSKKTPIKQDYVLEKKLGAGAFGYVILAVHKASQQKRAIKCIFKYQINDVQNFQNEVSILSELDHPNVIKLFETYESNTMCYLVMEFCQGGELFYHITKQKKLTENQAAQASRQIISAIRYCHSKNICHRDIKPENFLLLNENDDQSIKLIDFGLSKKVNKETIMTSIDGTAFYVAPEVLNQSYTYHCDNWSLGVLLYVMLTGSPPFGGKKNEEIMTNILKNEVSFQHPAFQTVSQSAQDLISKLIVKDIKQRFTSEQAYNHPWIQLNVQASAQEIVIPTEILGNLQSFLDSQKLKRATLTYIACKIPEGEVKQLKNAFIKLDKDGNGTLTREELEKGIAEIGKQLDSHTMDNLVKVMDSNQNGVLDYTEFIAACMSCQQYVKENILKDAFQAMDQDKSGKITIDELKEFFKGGEELTQEELEKIIKEVDKDNDGTVSYNEFIEMMKEIKN